MMKANYHTHTARCGHAEGTDEEYVLAAIERGFDELGFSDHVPWPYQDGYTHPSVRMRVDQMPGYLNSVRALAAQYKDKIHILTGFECEYFPDYMNWLADMRAENHLDYLILGNHFDHDDEYGMYFGNIRTAAQLRRYVDSAVKGLETGLFSYLAHPDLIYTSQPVFDETCREAAYTLCEEAKKLDLPLEYNLYGVDKRARGEFSGLGYPCAPFWEIAAKTGVRAIIGFDAHKLQHLCERARYEAAKQYLEGLGLPLVQRLF